MVRIDKNSSQESAMSAASPPVRALADDGVGRVAHVPAQRRWLGRLIGIGRRRRAWRPSRTVAGGRVGDVGPAQRAHLAPPHPGLEDEPGGSRHRSGRARGRSPRTRDRDRAGAASGKWRGRQPEASRLEELPHRPPIRPASSRSRSAPRRNSRNRAVAWRGPASTITCGRR